MICSKSLYFSWLPRLNNFRIFSKISISCICIFPLVNGNNMKRCNTSKWGRLWNLQLDTYGIRPGSIATQFTSKTRKLHLLCYGFNLFYNSYLNVRIIFSVSGVVRYRQMQAPFGSNTACSEAQLSKFLRDFGVPHQGAPVALRGNQRDLIG